MMSKATSTTTTTTNKNEDNNDFNMSETEMLYEAFNDLSDLVCSQLSSYKDRNILTSKEEQQQSSSIPSKIRIHPYEPHEDGHIFHISALHNLLQSQMETVPLFCSSIKSTSIHFSEDDSDDGDDDDDDGDIITLQSSEDGFPMCVNDFMTIEPSKQNLQNSIHQKKKQLISVDNTDPVIIPGEKFTVSIDKRKEYVLEIPPVVKSDNAQKQYSECNFTEPIRYFVRKLVNLCVNSKSRWVFAESKNLCTGCKNHNAFGERLSVLKHANDMKSETAYIGKRKRCVSKYKKAIYPFAVVCDCKYGSIATRCVKCVIVKFIYYRSREFQKCDGSATNTPHIRCTGKKCNKVWDLNDVRLVMPDGFTNINDVMNLTANMYNPDVS